MILSDLQRWLVALHEKSQTKPHLGSVAPLSPVPFFPRCFCKHRHQTCIVREKTRKSYCESHCVTAWSCSCLMEWNRNPPTPDDGRGSASEEHPGDGRACAGFWCRGALATGCCCILGAVAWLQLPRGAFAGGFCSILDAFQELF